MGLKRIKYILIAVLVAAAAGTAIILSTGSPQKNDLNENDKLFINLYIELALAREMAGNNQDSLKLKYDDIFETCGADSSWMFNYVTTISQNADKQVKIWDMILEKLDSLKTSEAADSDYTSSSRIKADSR